MKEAGISNDFIRDDGVARRLWLMLCDAFALQKPQFILFIPIIMAFGIGFYFSLKSEPVVLWAPLVFLMCLAVVFFVRGVLRFVFVIGLLLSLGFSAAQIRTHHVYTPILTKQMKFADIEGRIEAIEDFDKGVRILLSGVVIEDLAPEQTPRKLRLKLWKGDGLKVGQRIKALAALNPPSPPVIPRGFDFQRYMYFKGIGGVGFIYKPPEILEDRGGAGVIQSMRYAIGQRVQGGLEQPASGLALALLIGQRTLINKADIEAVRVAGLAHMLAISGLHIGLFSGALFFMVRVLMALKPSFALRHPIKKYAAVFALLGALFYMLIAGSSIPAQRAMISVAVFFLAVLLDRSAISLRVVAFAAFAVLLLFPESLTSVSFQMSFAAVAALVAFYDLLRSHWSRWYGEAGVLRRAGLYFVGVSMTTVVATFATAPFALFHFQQLAVYGLLANLLSVPILAFMIMPGLVLALVLMPLGLEGLALAVIEPGLKIMLWIAHFVADLNGSALHMPQWPFYTLVLCVFAGLSLIVLRGYLRVILGCVFLVAAGVTFHVKQADILISSKYDLVALRGNDPFLHVPSRKKERFSLENWERSMGFERGSARSFPKEGAVEEDGFVGACGEQGCRFTLKNHKIAYLRSEDGLHASEDCGWADIVLSKQPVRVKCGAGLSLNKFDIYRHGAHAIYLGDGEGDAIRVERTEDFRGKRLWNVYHQKSKWKSENQPYRHEKR